MGVRTSGRFWHWAAMALLGLSCYAIRAQQAPDEGRVPLVVSASDADGDTLKYEWVQVGGPKARIDAPSQPRTFFTPTEPGEYIFEIRVSDGQETASDRVTFVVKPPNQPPIALVNAPQKVAFGESVRLDGSSSKDPDGKIVQFRWKQVTGPKVVLADDKFGERELEFKPPEAGDYVFELEVFDGKAWSAPTRATFTVAQPNRRPRISLQTAKQEVELPSTEPATKTADPRTEPKAEPKAEPKSEPKAEPKATDKKPPKSNAMPIADAGKGGMIKVGEELILDASASSDPQGEELTYKWEQKAGEGPVLREIRHDPTSAKSGRRGPDYCPVWRCRPSEPGVYEFVLEVGAGKGGKRKALSTVAWRVEAKEVAKQNRPPLLDVPALVSGKAGHEVRIEAMVTDPENDPVDVTWTLLDPADLKIPAAALTQRTLVFTPPGKGVYVFGVVAQDGSGRSEPKQVELKVTGSAPVIAVAKPDQPTETKADGPKNRAPQAAIKPIEKPLIVKGMGQLDGTLSSDEDGNKLTYRWTVLEGAERIALEVVDQPRLNILGLAAGAVKIQLIVNDGQADSPAAALAFEVQEGAEEPAKPATKPPTARCELVSRPPFQVGKPLEFSGAKSSDPEAKPLVFQWRTSSPNADQLKIPGDAGERMTATPEAAGDFSVELVVTSGDARSEPVSVTFRVEEPKRKPIAVIAPITACEAGGKIMLDATPSQSVRGKSLGYRWNCVSNPPDGKVNFGWSGAKRNKVEVNLPKAGEYVFELKVIEADEESEPVRATVQTRAPNQAPQASLVAVSGFSEEDLAQKDLFKLPHVLKSDTLTVEEGWSVILDASGSKDPDGGPQPLTCKWKHISGPQPVRPHSEGTRLRFDAPAPGTLVHDVIVTDGKDDSAPARVTINILKAKTLPVSIPRAYVSAPGAEAPAVPAQPVIEIPVFKKNKLDPGDPVLILDGQMSTFTPTPGSENRLRYIWKQIGGEDLQLKPEKLAKPRVGLLVYHPGQYRFMLVVNDGQYASRPASIDIIVKDPSLGTNRPAIDVRKPEEKKAAPKPDERKADEKKPDAQLNALEERLRLEAEEKLKSELKPKPEAESTVPPKPDTNARAEEKMEDEGDLLPPPKDAKAPEPAGKQPVKPDGVAFDEDKGEVHLASAGGGIGPVQPLTGQAGSKDTRSTQPAAPVAPLDPKDPAREVKPLELEPIPGEVTERVQRLQEKKYRADDPVFQRFRKRTEVLALKPGSESEDELILMLRDKDEDLRAAAALALVQRGLGSVPALIRVLENREQPGRADAHWALRHLSHKSFPPDAIAWKKWWSDLLTESAP